MDCSTIGINIVQVLHHIVFQNGTIFNIQITVYINQRILGELVILPTAINGNIPKSRFFVFCNSQKISAISWKTLQDGIGICQSKISAYRNSFYHINGSDILILCSQLLGFFKSLYSCFYAATIIFILTLLSIKVNCLILGIYYGKL